MARRSRSTDIDGEILEWFGIPSTEAAEEAVTEAKPETAAEEAVTEAQTAPREAPKPPLSHPPRILPCGHVDWSPHETEDAQAKGLCCAGAVYNYAITWTVAGLRRPVPPKLRRVRKGKIGFPGYCCDPTTGLYIGGLGNDCRRYGLGTLCEEHDTDGRAHQRQADPPDFGEASDEAP